MIHVDKNLYMIFKVYLTIKDLVWLRVDQTTSLQRRNDERDGVSR